MTKIRTRFTNFYRELSSRTVFIVFFIVSFLVRLPFFFRDYIDRDESTFILMGQSWVDGHLPYTELWDLKPPLTFLFFAAIISVFGKSLIAIRLAGTFIVALTAFFTYKISRLPSTQKVAFRVGLACVLLQSLFGSIQGVMSEHICMFFFMPGLYLFVRYKKLHWYLLSGLFMGLAVMTKLNIVYAVLFLACYGFYNFYQRREMMEGLKRILIFGAGCIAILFLTFLPYILQGESVVWWKSVVIAPLQYAEAGGNSPLKMVPPFLIIALFLYLCRKKKWLDFRSPIIGALLAATLGVLLSFIQVGRINSHYLIQLYPILIILVAIAFSSIRFTKKLDLSPYLFILMLIAPIESYREYYAIAKNKLERGTFYNGEGFTVPQYILEHKLETENIFFLGYHIGYWILDKKPPTKVVTHPSNLQREELFSSFENPRETGIDELKYIMENVRPQTVIVRKNRLVFNKRYIELNTYIDNHLARNYTLHKTVDQAEIYQRSK